MYTDKIKGTLVAFALGDALGAPHEPRGAKVEFTGTLVHNITWFNRFHGERVYEVGSVTDDTQMTFALANQLIIDNGYNSDNIILAYERFAGACPMLGKNTRELFKGVTTLRGYQNRYSKKFSVPIDQWSQSNGSLMRCSPLAMFAGYDELIVDTKLSNPHPNNIGCGVIYVFVLKNLLVNGVLPNIVELFQYANQPDVTNVLNDVKDKRQRDIFSKSVKGWVCTALYSALYAIYHIPTVTEAFEYFIKQGGDTDTNAAILGALYGAKLGFNNVYSQQKDNIDIMMKVNQIPFDLVSAGLSQMLVKNNNLK